MKTKYLIYFCKGIESVFDSQVLELIISLNEKKVFEKVYLFLGIKSQLESKEFQKRKLPKEIGIVFFKVYPNYAFFNFLSRRAISKALKRMDFNLEESIFHVREEILTWHIRKILNRKYRNKILPDIRGACLEEIMENDTLKFPQKYFKIWNFKRALNDLRKFQKISAVTEALKKYLIKKYKINSDNIVITPNLAGKNFSFDLIKRMQIRKSLNLNINDILILFSSGSTQKWQNWQDINALKTLADKGMKIFNLSKYEILHKNIINKFVEYYEVPSYLNAADIAIIWSNKRTVSEVRSPVKFSEYICCGLPIIANDSVDMVTDYIKRSSFGSLLNDLNELDQEKIKVLKSLNRQEIAIKGMEWLGVETISQKYLGIYSSL